MTCGQMRVVSFCIILPYKNIFVYWPHQVPVPLGIVLYATSSQGWQAVESLAFVGPLDIWQRTRKPWFPSVSPLSRKTTRCVTVGWGVLKDEVQHFEKVSGKKLAGVKWKFDHSQIYFPRYRNTKAYMYALKNFLSYLFFLAFLSFATFFFLSFSFIPGW